MSNPLFNQLAMPEAISGALVGAGMATMTQVQAQTLPDSLAGRDVLAQASTGSGKTIAFAVARPEQGGPNRLCHPDAGDVPDPGAG